MTLGFVGLVAFGVNNAFFSDTETSTDNLFQAGEIDLQVDHFLASYNGQNCLEDCVEQPENLVTNGGFETPEVTHATQWDIFDSPVGGWTVEWRGDIPATFDPPPPGGTIFSRPAIAKLELHEGVLGSAFEGDQYAELDTDWNGHTGSLNNEPASVLIYQDIVTVPGKDYKLRFAFAPRPNTAAAQNRLEVQWDGVVVHDTGNVAGGGGPIAWTVVELDVTAVDALTRLQFTDLGTANSLGTFLDRVSLNEVLCDQQIGDFQCNLWEEKDLEPGDFFWNFSDVKPGDFGRNVFSLHVFSNDAWACMFMDPDDQENTLTEPEIEAGDTTDPEGEIVDAMDFVIWREVGSPDGIFNPGGEETLMPDSFFDIWVDVEIPPDPLIASTTRYYGIAWCFGTQTVDTSTGVITCDGTGDHNDAQTDTLTVDIDFYAEQSRNNPDFDCQELPPPNAE